MKLVWRPSARRDHAEIINYIGERNLAAAQKLSGAIHACAERLLVTPHGYRPGRVAGTREAVVHPNYILVYRVTADLVEIVNLVHVRKSYP